MPPLSRQVVPVLLKGLDQRAPKQTGIMSGLDVLLNMYAQQGDVNGYEFVPRPGTTAVAAPASAGGAANKLATLNGQLLMFTDTKLWRRAADAGLGWHNANPTGTFRLSSQKTTPIYTEANGTTNCDVAYVGGFTVTAAATLINNVGFASPGIAITVVDSTGAYLEVPFKIATTGSQQVRIAVVGQFAIIFWAESSSNAIRAVKFDSSTGFLSGPTSLITNVSMAFTPIFDVQATSTSTIAIIWNDNTTSFLNGALLTPTTMAISASTVYNLKGTSFVTKGFMANSFSPNANLMFAYIAASGLHCDVINSTTMAPVANTTISVGTTTGDSITGYRTSSTLGTVFYTAKGTLPFDDAIMISASAPPTLFMSGRAIASRSTDQSSGVTSLPLMLTKYRGVGQATYFLIDGAKADMARAMPDVAGADPANALVGLTVLPNLMIGATSTTYLTAGLKSVALDSGATGLTSVTGAASIAVVVSDTALGRPVELNGSLHMPGALPMLYDGVSVVEDGFPLFPEQSDAYVIAAGGGMTASSAYTYRYVFEWVDNANALHRSGPNLSPQQAVLGVGQTQVTHSIPTVINSRKQVITVAIERTPANGDGSVYYKVGQVTFIPAPGSPTRVTFLDQVSDAILVTGIPLYTDGAILENLAPPPCTMMAIHRGRLLAGGIDGDPTAVWFTKDVIPGFGIAWNDGLVSRLNSANEPVTALGSMDSYAAAFTNSTTWASSNDYPDDTGNGGVLQFSQSSSTNGAAAPRLVARADDGLTAWQAKTTFTGGPGPGPWRLSRGLAWEWIGKDIQLDAAALTPRAMIPVPGLSQVRIVGQGSASGTALVHETTFDTWATWTYLVSPSGAPTITDAIVWGSVVAYLCSDANILLESTAVYSDSATSIAHLITLSPFNFAGVAGYQRIYVGQLTGRLLGDLGLSESMVVGVTQTIDGTAMAAKVRTLTPDANGLFAGVEFDPGPNGKCSAYQVTISNAAGGANDARCAWTLAAVTMEVGIKPNVNRLAPANRAV